MAIDIVREIGGEENVKSLAHCMTRLRFIVKDEKESKSGSTEKRAEGVIQVNGCSRTVSGCYRNRCWRCLR